MTVRLCIQVMTRIILGFMLIAISIFLPAGTLSFFNGWLLLGLLFVPMVLAGLVLMLKNPALLKKRLQAKEPRQEQVAVIKWSALMFLAGFIVAGLNHRFDWYILPEGVVMAAAIVFLIAYLLYAEVLRENTYLSRTIQVEEDQTVIDTGLYGIVRHPMYSATILLFLSMPLMLGCVFSFLIFLTYPLILAKRIKDEESLLENELEGYREYQQRVRYRLIPFVW